MSDSRQRPALGLPPADLARFPRSRLLPSVTMHRAHTAGKSPWWFSSDLSGRFDLIQPNGTCYLATDVATALRERYGHELVRQGVVTFQTAARTQVSSLRVPSVRWLANIRSPAAANFGMTREIGACPSYEIPQAWAAALFDAAGEHDWLTDPHPVHGLEACADVGITVVHRPTRRQVRIVQPPR